MRTLIISDIHANLPALEAVLNDAGEIDAVWCLGDLVGYGPDPNECITRVKELPNLTCLLGNHDAAVINQIDIDTFNPDARITIEWMQKNLDKECQAFLEKRPHRDVVDNVTLAHGSPRNPVYEYLLDTRAATWNFEYFETDYCFVGHTHLPVIFMLNDTNTQAQLTIPVVNTGIKIKPRAILNPGSVGQPRDRDPRAAYAIYDTDKNTWEYRRVAYDIQAVQKRMRKASLPERHILRLEAGW